MSSNANKKRLRKAERKLSPALRHIVTTKWSHEEERKYRDKRLGSFGAASPVRNIDPTTNQVIK